MRILESELDGPDVKIWQEFLAGQGLGPGKPDGSFGEQTDRATKAFQAAHGLKPDGKASDPAPGDLILCQITSRAHSDAFAVPLDHADFERGQLPQPGFIRPQRLFTVEHHIILHSVGKVTAAKFDEVFKKARALFVD